MELTGDDRGQSLQIGAVILFGALILLSTYQAFVVPNQNGKSSSNTVRPSRTTSRTCGARS